MPNGTAGHVEAGQEEIDVWLINRFFFKNRLTDDQLFSIARFADRVDWHDLLITLLLEE